MQPLRILIVTHSILSAEFGAGQMAINLAEALRKQGHDVTLWSPHPMPSMARWWQSLQSLQLMRSKLDVFIETQEPFDIIDCFASFITKQVSKSGSIVVARSVQPDILYILSDLTALSTNDIKKLILLPFNYFLSVANIFLVIQGWRRSTYILCLGSIEIQWMKKWFSWWRSKLFFYVNAISKAEQEALAQIRRQRKKHEVTGIRFLWIGRWVAHKGITELLDFIVKRAASHPQDSFTIAGCGTDAEKDCPLELIQSNRLKILPSFERSQLYSLLENHDVGLFTSKVEGWGLILNEMLESGMPIFATPVGGVVDLQPFFKEMLKPFPPPLQLTPEILSQPTYMENYYHTFTWEKIAENYISSIFKN
jgi:glycosyltransferase involved in cell wall biosynthesis